jgi:hypothetical protein
MVSDNKKSARRAKARLADFSLGPIRLEQKGFILALDKCSNRYPLVGGMRQRCFDGTNFKPPKLLENAQTPTTMAPTHFVGDRVHAVLARFSLLSLILVFLFLPVIKPRIIPSLELIEVCQPLLLKPLYTLEVATTCEKFLRNISVTKAI